MKQLEAKPIRHKDVAGKEKYYVQITNGERNHIIIVGKGTVEELESLQELEGANPKQEKADEIKTKSHASKMDK